MSTSDNDLTLIQRFVEGKASLESNPNLRVESALDTTRLFTKKGAFLAAINLALNIRSVLVRQESQYGEAISQALLERNFVPTGVIEQGLMRYEQHPIPSGYEMKRTEARLLWRSWRTQQQQSSTQQKLLIYTPKGWQSVQKVSVNEQLVFVETPDEEIMIHNGDRIVWLSPLIEQPET